MNKTTTIALFYASKGFDVFPVQPRSKYPYKDFTWDTLATRDNEIITRWFESEYKNANIGIACGARSGLVVLDVDAGHGGIETLEALEDTHGKLPVTPRAKTGGGGYHYVFRHPGREVRNSASKVGPGIDIRGDGGYIVAPPSIHPDGPRYQWLDDYKPSDTPLAEMPAWLLGLATKDGGETKQEETQQANGEVGKIPAGKRNQTLTSLAGTMRKRGMSQEAIFTALMVENNARCVPPLPDTDVLKISESVNRYDHDEPEERRTAYADIEWTFAAAAYGSPDLARGECGWLRPFFFTDRKIRAFWSSMLGGVDPVQAATETGILSDLLAWQYRTNPNELARYANQIARMSYLTEINAKLTEVSHCISEGEVSKVQTILGELAGKIPYTGKDPLTAADASEQFIELLSHLDGRNIMTGIPKLDKAIGGLERQTMSILAARPSMGKSTLAWQIARNVTAGGMRVAFISLEMAATNLIARAVCGIVGVPWVEVRTGNVTPEQLEKINREARRFGEFNADKLLIDDGQNTSDTIWQMSAKYRPDLIVIDHLRLVGDRNENEVIRLGTVTQRMKDLSKRMNCHVLILAQLSRKTENRGSDTRPKMSDLRDSGQIEENADLVLMLHREDYYDDTIKNGRYSPTEILVRKARDGEMNSGIKLDFDKVQQWFVDQDEKKPRL